MKRVLAPFRLIDGVIVAAIALLSLKALGLLMGGGEERAGPGFARVVSHARSNYVPAEPQTTGSVPEKDPKPKPAAESVAPPQVVRAPPLIPSSLSEKGLLERLGERREELQQRQREMEAREKLLQDQERKFEDRLGQDRATEEARKSAAAPKANGDPAALKPLVVMYETMKPKEAARVFERLPIDVLLPVVTQMNARKMSEVLAAMSPETAEKLTIALAKRARASGDEKAATAGAGLPPGELPAIERPAAPR